MVDAMCHLNSMIVKRELEALPVTVWREICSPYGNVSEGYQAVNQRLMQGTAQQLRQAQQRGRISSQYDPLFIAEFLNDYCTLILPTSLRMTSASVKPLNCSSTACIRSLAAVLSPAHHSILPPEYLYAINAVGFSRIKVLFD